MQRLYPGSVKSIRQQYQARNPTKIQLTTQLTGCWVALRLTQPTTMRSPKITKLIAVSSTIESNQFVVSLNYKRSLFQLK